MFSPFYGRGRKTVRAHYENAKKLKIDETTRLLIEEYNKVWEEKGGHDRKSFYPYGTAKGPVEAIHHMASGLGLTYILQGKFLESPGWGLELLKMKKECQDKEMATFFNGLARKLIKKSIEKEKQ